MNRSITLSSLKKMNKDLLKEIEILKKIFVFKKINKFKNFFNKLQ